MVWVKLDDGFVRHPRMVAAGLNGRALFIAGLCYCGAHLTDGMIPKAAVRMLAAEAGVGLSTAKRLVEVGSWIDRGDDYEVHDFLVYNPARAQVLAEREVSRRRWALNNDPEMRRVIQARDGDHCRYCGDAVNWRDRKGAKGATYDHVIPVCLGGTDDSDNIVVSCRDCNSRKGGRTPEQAGMVLLDPPQIKHGSGRKSEHPSRPVHDVPSERDTHARASVDEQFESWWSAYPRKIAKQHALKAYRAAVKHASPEQLDEGLAASTCTWQRERRPMDKIPHAATWLNGHRWADEHTTVNGSNHTGQGPVTATIVELPA